MKAIIINSNTEYLNEFKKLYCKKDLLGKPAAAVVSCRRGGAFSIWLENDYSLLYISIDCSYFYDTWN